jgi:hypothetical protein
VLLELIRALDSFPFARNWRIEWRETKREVYPQIRKIPSQYKINFYFISENILHQRTIFYLIIVRLTSSFDKELIFKTTHYIFFYLSSEVSSLENFPIFLFLPFFPIFLLFFFTLSPLPFFPLTQHPQQALYVYSSVQSSPAQTPHAAQPSQPTRAISSSWSQLHRIEFSPKLGTGNPYQSWVKDQILLMQPNQASPLEPFLLRGASYTEYSFPLNW